MSAGQNWLIQGGLILILLGVVYGLVYTFRVEHQTLPVLRESYREAFTAAAVGDVQRAQSELERARRMNYEYVRAIDAHTHVIKLATLVVLTALVWPVVSWKEKTKKALAIGLITGAWLFPSGVFAEIFFASRVPQAVAATGALLAIGSFTLLLWGIIRKIAPCTDGETRPSKQL